MTYTITASDAGTAVTATRVRPSSACVLARKWVDRGFTNVTILWDGRSYALDAFLSKYVLDKGGMTLRGRDIRTW